MQSAFSKAVDLLSRAEQSALDIRLKLKKKGYDEEEIKAAIAKLYDLHYLSDRRYAESYIRRYSGSKSRSLITRELYMKDIHIDDLDLIFDEVYEYENLNEEKIIRSLLEHNFKNADFTDEKVKKRAISFLIRHGFNYSSATLYLT